MIRRLLEKAMKENRVIRIVSDCDSDQAVVINAGADSVTVCDTPQLLDTFIKLQRLARKQSRESGKAFARGELKKGLKHGHFTKHLHGCITRLSDDLSIRTIKFSDLIGFTI